MTKKSLNKFIIFCMVLSLITTILFACNKVDNNNSNNNTKNTYSASDTYPEKTRLVWVANGLNTKDIDIVFKAFNQRLVERGYDFVVDFINIEATGDEYQTKIRKMRDTGEQADLIFSDFSMGGNYTPRYDDFVKEGLYEALNSYMEKEIGQRLYQSKSPLVWDTLRVNGDIYAVDTRAVPSFTTYLIFNKKYLDKYKIDISQFSGESIWDLEEYLKIVYEGEKDSEDFIPLLIDIRNNVFPTFEYITNTIGVKLDVSEPRAVNIYEDENVRRYFKTIKNYYNAGYINNKVRESSNKESGNDNFFVMMSNFGPESYLNTVVNNTYKDSNGNPVEIITLPLQEAYLKNLHAMVTGIASWSEHKEEAVELLTLLYTEPEFANLLAYGIQERHYSLDQEGRVKYLEEGPYLLYGDILFSNQMITYPSKNEPLTKKEDVREYQKNLKQSPILGFRFEAENVISYIKETEKIVMKYSGLWTGSFDNVDETLDKLNNELKQAGITKIQNEINNQIAEGYTN